MQYPLVELALGLVFAATYHYWPVPVVGGQWVLLVTWLAVSIGLLALAVYDLRWMLLPNKMLYPAAAVAAVGRVIYIVGYDTDKLQALLAWLLSVAVAGGIFWLIYELSKGRAIGFGDVRLGLVSGTVLADPILSFQMIFVASVLGTLVAIPGLLSKKQTMTSKIPYGPFLIAATFVVLLFGASFTNWYQRLLT